MALTREDVRSFCAGLPAATSDYPFGPEVQIFRVGGKVFALLSEVDDRVSLKCDPALAEILRQNFAGVIPGYHLNKRHWNTVELDTSVPDEQIEEMIAHSYELVLASLPKKIRQAIAFCGRDRKHGEPRRDCPKRGCVRTNPDMRG